MTTFLRFLFVLYIALLSSFDSALAEEFEEIGHMMSHKHSASQSDDNVSAGMIVQEDEIPNDNKENHGSCPESEGMHTCHQCHMGHCGYLPTGFVLKNVIQNNDFSTGYHQLFQSRTLDSLFKPPRFS